MRHDDNIFMDPWQYSVTETAPENKRIYVSVSGNSGAGKSTLIESLARAIQDRDAHTIAIDEKSLHHPFLPHLFFEPKSFAFELQLNFMLQRALLIKHWLGSGYNLVMERSHIEDVVFIRHLLREGLVTKDEHDVYMALWHSIDGRLAYPGLMVFLDVRPEVSLKRLTDAENEGTRPKEFPDESRKQRWITSWCELYRERIDEIKKSTRPGMKVVILDGERSASELTQIALTGIGSSDRGKTETDDAQR